MDNLNIVYNYHEHEGSEDSTANGCYTKAVYHSHTSSCYKYCSGVWVYRGKEEDSHGTKQGVYTCSVCGHEYRAGAPYIDGGGAGQSCGQRSLNCSRGGTIETYKLGCGKTEDTIESATIIY